MGLPRVLAQRRWRVVGFVLGVAGLGLAAPARADELQQFLKKSHKSKPHRAGPRSDQPAPDATPPANTNTPVTAPDDSEPPPSLPAGGIVATPPNPARGAPAARAAAGPVGRPGDQRAIFSLNVNMVDKGEVFVVLRRHDALVLTTDLEGAGLGGLVGGASGARETIGGKTYVSVQSLASTGLTYELDERALVLRLTAPTAGLGHTAIDLRPGRPGDVVSNDDGSAFVNYALRLQDLRHASAFGEAGATYKNALLYSQGSVDPDGHAVRGLSNLSYAIPERLQRLILGDTLASSGVLGGSLFLGGVTFERDFNLDPYFFRFPSAGLSGAVSTPSTVDVYVNGMLVHREELAPGTFDVSNLPLTAGAGNTRIVVRDAYGREQVVTTPYYFSTGILKPGVSDYAFSAGYQRNNLATKSWDYSPAVFLGRYRFGATSVLTPGARVEGADGLLSGGPAATVRTAVGDVEGDLAASYDDRSGGTAASLSYTYLRPTLSGGALLQAYSARYANLSLPVTRDRPKGAANVFAGTTLGPRVSVTLRASVARNRDAGNSNQEGVLANVRVHETANLFATATRTASDAMTKPLYEIFVSLSVALPDRATASAFYDQEGAQGTGGADVQRSLPVGPGYGYHVRASVGPVDDFLADGQAQSAYGRYEASVERIGGHDTSIVTASGALVTVGGHAFATRPVEQGFGLIEVPGRAGVRGYVNNQEVGHTDGDGDLLVPEMIPYYANRVSIADEDLPMDFKIDATERLLAPPLRGGAVARFDVERLRAVTGSVVMSVAGTDVDPSFGEMLVHAGGAGTDDKVSPLGRHGEFYFEGLPAGTYGAEIDSAAGTCRLQLVVPASDKAIIDAGRAKCIGRVPPGLMAPGAVEPLPAAPPRSPRP
jgi:outer membrane usher protein